MLEPLDTLPKEGRLQSPLPRPPLRCPLPAAPVCSERRRKLAAIQRLCLPSRGAPLELNPKNRPGWKHAAGGRWGRVAVVQAQRHGLVRRGCLASPAPPHRVQFRHGLLTCCLFVCFLRQCYSGWPGTHSTLHASTFPALGPQTCATVPGLTFFLSKMAGLISAGALWHESQLRRHSTMELNCAGAVLLALSCASAVLHETQLRRCSTAKS